MWAETFGILDCGNLKSFWVDWFNGTIRVGNGYTIGSDIILEGNVPGYTEILDVALSTRTSPGEWQYSAKNGELTLVVLYTSYLV